MLHKGSHRSDRKEKNKWILMNSAGVKAIIQTNVIVSSAYTSTSAVAMKEKKNETN